MSKIKNRKTIIGIVIFMAAIFLLVFITVFKKEPIEGLIYSKTFKNGLDPSRSKEKYINVFKEAQNLTDIPIKYPTELPEGYELFKVELWNKENSENIDIYYDINYEDLLKKNIIVIEGTSKSLKTYNVNEDKKTILLKEGTFKAPVIEKIVPKEISLLNNKKGFLWTLRASDEPIESLYEHMLYIGYTKIDEKEYLYLINSNIPKEEMIFLANSIIKNDRNK